jgi:hypothetical protein
MSTSSSTANTYLGVRVEVAMLAAEHTSCLVLRLACSIYCRDVLDLGSLECQAWSFALPRGRSFTWRCLGHGAGQTQKATTVKDARNIYLIDLS